MAIRYKWYPPTTGMVALFVGSLCIAACLFGLVELVSWGNPTICFEYGCATLRDYIAGVLLCLTIIFCSVALFMLPFCFDMVLLSLPIMIGSLFVLANCHQTLHPLSGGNADEATVDAFKAVAHGCPDKLASLLSTHSNIVHITGHRRNTLLHQAVARRKDECVRLLITGGAYVNATNQVGHTPLDIAQHTHNASVSGFLFAHGGQTASNLLSSTMSSTNASSEARDSGAAQATQE